MTKTGAVIGTPHYMSPEQVRGVDVDHRTDVYAFGVILYELLSGKLPFEANTYGALVLQIVLETPEPLQRLAPELPPGFIKIVSQAMARNAAERFQSLELMAAQLEPYARVSRRRPSPRRTRRCCLRRRAACLTVPIRCACRRSRSRRRSRASSTPSCRPSNVRAVASCGPRCPRGSRS